MAISFLNVDGLWPLLDGGVRIAIANQAGEESAASLVGAVVALHGAQGAPQVRRSTEIDLATGESFAFDDDRPAPTGVLAVEAILRVMSPIARVIAEIYVRSDATRTTPIAGIEVGIITTDDAPAGAVPIPEIEGLSAYLKLEP